MNLEAISNRVPFKVAQCALPDWLERTFELSSEQQRASSRRFRIVRLKNVARMILVGVPLPAFVIHTQGDGRHHALVSGGDIHGILNRLFSDSETPSAGTFVIRLELIRDKLAKSRQRALAAIIDDECVEEGEPSPASPALASLLESNPPADLDPNLTSLWTQIRDDVCDFQIAYFELNRTRSELAFQCRSELLTKDRGMGRLLVQPALAQLRPEPRRTSVDWLELDRPGAHSDLAESVIQFAGLLLKDGGEYEEIRSHAHKLYTFSGHDAGLPPLELVRRLAHGDVSHAQAADFLARGLWGACRLWRELLRPVLMRPTERPDIVVPLIFVATALPQGLPMQFASGSTAVEHKFAVRFWRSLLNSSGEMSVDSLRDLVRLIPRKVPRIDDPRDFLKSALPYADEDDTTFDVALLDYLNSPSVLPTDLLPPHPPAGDDTTAAWTPLHEQTSRTERPHIEHLFPRALMERLAAACGMSALQRTPAESFLNKWLLDGKLNMSKSAKTIHEFIEHWKSKYPAPHVERWAQAHGIPNLDQLAKLEADSDLLCQLRTLLQWKAQRLWMLVSHLQVDRQRVGLNPQYVHDRLMKYLPRSFNHPS